MFLCLSIFFHFPLSLSLFFNTPIIRVLLIAATTTTTETVLTAGRSTYWDGPRTSSPGQSLANLGLQCSRKNESANSPTELYLKSVTTTTTSERAKMATYRSP